MDFLYLGHIVAFNNSNWEALYQNLRKPYPRWGIVAELLTRMRETLWEQAMIYKAVVRTELLYGSDRWVVN